MSPASPSDTPPLAQAIPRPTAPKPVVALGAGNIVREAHIPAYRAVGIHYAGFFDLDLEQAGETRDLAGEGEVYEDLAAATALGDRAVYDIAVPAERVLELVRVLPEKSAALIQKPLGRDLAEARAIVSACRERQLTAAVNFQLRFAPSMLALRDAITRGRIGTPTELEVRIDLHTPWGNWAFLEGIPRMEVLYHSIHYLDLVRHLVGEPTAVRGVSRSDARLPGHADTGTTLLLDIAPGLRTIVHTNHAHDFGRPHATSELKLEGSAGAGFALLGVNLDYPRGEPDRLELAPRSGDWTEVPLRGSWFPEAFEGPMAQLQSFAAGETEVLWTRVDDALRTMALVEAAYTAFTAPGTPVCDPEEDLR